MTYHFHYLILKTFLLESFGHFVSWVCYIVVILGHPFTDLLNWFPISGTHRLFDVQHLFTFPFLGGGLPYHTVYQFDRMARNRILGWKSFCLRIFDKCSAVLQHPEWLINLMPFWFPLLYTQPVFSLCKFFSLFMVSWS